MTAKTTSKFPVGKTAFLHDIHCHPKETGACTIIAPSKRGPEWAIVEWDAEPFYHDLGDVSVIELRKLDIR